MGRLIFSCGYGAGSKDLQMDWSFLEDLPMLGGLLLFQRKKNSSSTQLTHILYGHVHDTKCSVQKVGLKIFISSPLPSQPQICLYLFVVYVFVLFVFLTAKKEREPYDKTPFFPSYSVQFCSLLHMFLI